MYRITSSSFIKDTRKRNKLYLFLLITVCILRVVYSFVYYKDGYHSDEIWSFGLSNSYYSPFIFQNSDKTDAINKNQWFSSQVMHNYLTVQKNEQFNYGSVYYNQVHDCHPPLYYFIVHTICSFFPDSFSVWYGFSINIFSLILTLLFLYKFILKISEDSILSVIGCSFYGLSLGALNTFVFIRMYSLLTMFAIIFIYYHAKLYYEKQIKNNLIILFFITLAGALTHHYFLPFAGLISFCFCVYYLIKKELKILIIYASSMLLSAGLSILIFPATIDHLLSGRAYEPKYPIPLQIKMTINCMITELLGCSIPVVGGFPWRPALIIMVCCTIIIIPLFYLFRKEAWFIKLIRLVKKSSLKLVNKLSKPDLIVFSIIISIIGTILIVSFTASHIVMGAMTDRYIFFIYPLFCSLVVIFLYYILRCFLKNSRIRLAVVALLCCSAVVFSNVNYRCLYFFQRAESDIDLETTIADSNCVIIIDQFWLLTCFTNKTLNTNYIYATGADDIENKVLLINAPESNNSDLYFIVDNNSFLSEDAVNQSADVYNGRMPELNIKNYNHPKITVREFEHLLEEKYSKFEKIGTTSIMTWDFTVYKV